MNTTLKVAAPLSAQTLGRGINLTWEEGVGPQGAGAGWSTRIGYEPYFPSRTSGYAPFNAIGRIDSLFVWQATPERYCIFLEAGGTLYLLHEWGGNTPTLVALQGGRPVPTLADPSSTYTPIGRGVLVCSSTTAPIFVQPWPIGDITQAGSSVSQLIRNFGTVAPPSPRPLGVDPIASNSGATHSAISPSKPEATSTWWPTTPGIKGYPGLAGIGVASTGTAPEDNAYSYAVSFVTDLGGESPLSPVAVLSWQIVANQSGTKYVPAVEIPVGPPGTVARKLWRSQNWAEGSASEGDDALYLSLIVPNNVDTFVWDYTKTAALGVAAPLPGERIPLPLSRPRYAAIHAGRLVLAGDNADPYTLAFSSSSSPETFSLGDVITLPQRGGPIVGLHAHYNMLLIFREKGLDVIDQNLNASTLLSNVSCVGGKTVVSTPWGVVFAARDGLYMVDGGLQGGAIVGARKISGGATISDVWASRVAPSGALLARAEAVWDAQRGEVWVQVPSLGSDRPDLGVVWHPRVPSPNDTGCFTLREGWPVGCFGTMPGGEVIFGHYEGMAGQGAQKPAGIFVVSARRAAGIELKNDAWVDAPPLTSSFRSPWTDFGEPESLKNITYVGLTALSTGNVDIPLATAHDGVGPWADAKPYLAQPIGKTDLPVYATDANDLTGATLPFNQTLQQDFSTSGGVGLTVRFSDALGRGQTFAFKLETDEDIVLLGYGIEGTATPMRPTGGKR